MMLVWKDIESWAHGRVHEAPENGRVRARIVEHRQVERGRFSCVVFIYDADGRKVHADVCDDIGDGYLKAIRQLC